MLFDGGIWREWETRGECGDCMGRAVDGRKVGEHEMEVGAGRIQGMGDHTTLREVGGRCEEGTTEGGRGEGQ